VKKVVDPKGHVKKNMVFLQEDRLKSDQAKRVMLNSFGLHDQFSFDPSYTIVLSRHAMRYDRGRHAVNGIFGEEAGMRS